MLHITYDFTLDKMNWGTPQEQLLGIVMVKVCSAISNWGNSLWKKLDDCWAQYPSNWWLTSSRWTEEYVNPLSDQACGSATERGE